MKKVIAFTLLCVSSLSVAGPAMDAKILGVGFNAHNEVFINFDRDLQQAGCPGKQLVLAAGSPLQSKLLAVAMAAKVSSATVQIKAAGCLGSQPSILTELASSGGWLLIQ